MDDVDVADVGLMIGEHFRQPEQHTGLIRHRRQNCELCHRHKNLSRTDRVPSSAFLVLGSGSWFLVPGCRSTTQLRASLGTGTQNQEPRTKNPKTVWCTFLA